MYLFAFTIFLSAFLLFLVQPLIARIILPWFGGTAAVWSTCLMFFQTTLLAGYLYAHWLTRALRPRRQALVHLALLAASVFALPILALPQFPCTSGHAKRPKHGTVEMFDRLRVNGFSPGPCPGPSARRILSQAELRGASGPRAGSDHGSRLRLRRVLPG